MKDQLKQARKAAKLRQNELAKIANVGVATIIRAETANVKLSTYKKIFDALTSHNQNNSVN
jgi:predicted transcriptional regulator